MFNEDHESDSDEWTTDVSSDSDSGNDISGSAKFLELDLKTALAKKIQEEYNELADILSGTDGRGHTEVTHANLHIKTVKQLISFLIRAEKILIDWYETGIAAEKFENLPILALGMDQTDVLRMFSKDPVPKLVLPKFKNSKEQDQALHDATKQVIYIVEAAANDKMLFPKGLYYKYSLAKWIECNIFDTISSVIGSINSIE